MARSNRVSLMDTYEMAYQNEWSETYNNAAPRSRGKLLKRMTDVQLNALYMEYFASLEAQIARHKKDNSPLATPAEDMLGELKFSISNEAKTSAPDHTLLYLLYKTDQLFKTPYLDETRNINPTFLKRAEDFHASLQNIKSDVKRKTLYGVGSALVAAVIIAAMITLAVFTFGIAGIVAAKTIALATISSAAQVTMAAYVGGSAIGFFSNAYRLNQIAKKMEPLDAALSIAANNK